MCMLIPPGSHPMKTVESVWWTRSISKYVHTQICLFERSIYSLVSGWNQLNKDSLSFFQALQDHLYSDVCGSQWLFEPQKQKVEGSSQTHHFGFLTVTTVERDNRLSPGKKREKLRLNRMQGVIKLLKQEVERAGLTTPNSWFCPTTVLVS